MSCCCGWPGPSSPAPAAWSAPARAVVFSVGPRVWLEELAAGYREFVDDFVSAEEAGVYKPHPGIYQYLLARTGAQPAASALVSSNPFDIAGAAAVGIRTAWCRRRATAVFDPWRGRTT